MSEYLLEELREPVEKLLNRHEANAHDWFAYETTPWSLARDFTDADPWNPDEHQLSKGVRSALFVNLLTEDNLPYYTNTILSQSPVDHPLHDWTHRWTREEGQHSIAIRDWIIATRAFDPRLLELGRRVQVDGGQVPQPQSLADMLAYTSFQELATNIAHRNTGRKLGKELKGAQVMAHVAGDEKLHYEFYRDTAVAALEIDPSTMVIAVASQIRHFAMPGVGIPDFKTHAKAMAREGIFNYGIMLSSVFEPVLRHFDLENVEGLSDEAKTARDGINGTLKAIAIAARREQRSFEQDPISTAH